MSRYEEQLLLAQEQDRIVYYDYLDYKRGAGWRTGLINDDWHRPQEIRKSKYNADFLKQLPNYYFLGFPIKEFLKTSNSNGRCHSCVVALSLYFKEFTIMTCNLKSYVEYYREHGQTCDEYEHTVLLINVDGIETVIDTTFGFITDLDTYKNIFDIENIRTISSDVIKKTAVYQFIDHMKFNEGLSHDSELESDTRYQEYLEHVNKFMDLCEQYNDSTDYHLQDFIRRCLYRTANSYCLWNLRNDFHYKQGNHKFEYPQINMDSLIDDEFDENLYSCYKDTIERNKRVLENYHKKDTNIFKKIKQKLFSSN